VSDLEVGVVVTAKVGNAVREVGKATNSVRRDTADVAQSQRSLARASDDAGRSTGRLGSALAGAGRRAAGMARSAAGAVGQIRAMGNVAGAAGRALDKVGNRYSALVTGAGAVGAARFIGNLQERFTRLGIQANIGADQVDALKRQIFEISRQKQIRVDPGEVTAGIERIIEKTGDLKLAQENIENIAASIQATGAGGADIGAMIADLSQKFDIQGADQMRKMLDTIVRQGKAGAFTLQNLAAMGERTTAAYAAMGRSGPDAVREMGALLQVARMGVGSAEQATTSFERLMSELVSKSKEIEGLGITVWDPEKLAEGQKVARSAVDIIKELMISTGGDIQKLGEIFGDESIRLLNSVKTEFQRTGDFKTMDSFLAVSGDGKQLLEDSARAADGANAAMRNMLSAWQTFADTKLTGPIQSLADLLNMMSSDKVDTLMSVLTYGAGAVGAAVVGRKVFKAGAALRGMFGGRGGAAGVGGAALAAAGGATPVIVTNWPAGGLGGFGGGKGTGKGVGKASPWGLGKVGAGLSGAGKLLGRVAMPLMVGMSLMDTVGAAASGDAKGVGSSLGSLGGTFAGAAAGAALGSVVPVIGTAIGGLAGGLLGSFAGEGLGGWLGGLFGGKGKEPGQEATPATGGRTGGGNQTITITVNPSAGMNEEALARRIQRLLTEQREEALHE
jgi:phage tail tape-measure protein